MSGGNGPLALRVRLANRDERHDQLDLAPVALGGLLHESFLAEPIQISSEGLHGLASVEARKQRRARKDLLRLAMLEAREAVDQFTSPLGRLARPFDLLVDIVAPGELEMLVLNPGDLFP